MQSAQEVFAINVDLHRNRVLRTTLLLTMLSTSFASAATVASFFGACLPRDTFEPNQCTQPMSRPD